MQNLRELRNYIDALCRKNHLSWRLASIQAGLYPGYISGLMRGRYSAPKADTLKALADALDGDYQYMLKLRGISPSHPVRTALERELMVAVGHLSPEDQERFLAMVEGLIAHSRQQAEQPSEGHAGAVQSGLDASADVDHASM